MAKNRKATKKFEKKKLKQIIEKRHKVQKFKKSVERRQFKKRLSSKNGKKVDTDLSKTIKTDQQLVNSDDGLTKEGIVGLKEKNDLEISDSNEESLKEEDDIDNFQIDDENEESEEIDVIKDDNDDDDDQNNLKSHKQKLSVQKDVLKLKKQIGELKDRDPKFYEYLMENDQELIEFDISDFESNSEKDDIDDENDIEGMNTDNEESGGDDKSNSENEDLDMDIDREEEKAALRESGLDHDNENIRDLTSEMIDKWILAITESKSLRSTHRLVLAFRVAAHINDDDEQSFAYKISNPSVFNNLVIVCLKYIPDVFDHHLNVKDSDSKNSNSICTHRKWKSVQTLVKSFLNSVLYILKQLTENDTLYFIIKEAEKLVPYYSCFPKLMGQYLKVLLQHWGTAEDKVRVVAFINIRKLAITAPPPFIDLCLKGVYMTFVRCCKETSIYTIPSINLMSNCAVEIYGLDFKSSYQSAFRYIRQLAIHLRNSMNIKSEETFNAVYNWQYIHCIELWSKVLATYCDEQRVATTGQNSLQELIYPFSQVCIGVLRLNPSAQYFPLQFHCVRALIHLMQKTGTFIPLAPYLFEMFHSTEMRRNAKPSTLKPLDFTIHLKAPKNYLRTTVYQGGICEELTEVLLEYYASFCLSIAFPELIIPAVFQIKRFIKDSKKLKINKQFQQLVQKLEENGKFIEQHRQHVDYGPGDTQKVKSFLRDVSMDSTPLGAYVKTCRNLKEQRRKLMETEKDN
ncbi:Noc2p family-domain-containing protein [Glomus cerebriforme]|uniref:Noc2p family-domain-containing protein n=1 Tax=Glomus cerebriforme TaxID=658196 RepID=A0A397TH75_9GLOM|nr:Noc2p family-domain-containing protein [Glomus cerebriforme]